MFTYYDLFLRDYGRKLTMGLFSLVFHPHAAPAFLASCTAIMLSSDGGVSSCKTLALWRQWWGCTVYSQRDPPKMSMNQNQKKQVSMSLNHPNYFSSLKFEKNAQFLFNWQINLEVCQLAIRFHCQPLPDSSFESASLAAAAVCAAARFSSAVFTAAYAEAKRGWVGQGKATCEVSAIVTIGKVLRRSISIRFRNFHRPSFLHAMIITMKHQRWTLGRRKKTWGTCRSRLQCWQLRTQGLWFRAKKNVHHFELWFIGDGWRLIVESTNG